MEHLYHLSHFFAFLCSVYFGSAILIFIDRDVIDRLYDPFNETLKNISCIRLLIEDYKQLLTSKMLKDVGFKDIFFSKILSPTFAATDNHFYNILHKRKNILDKWHLEKNRSSMLKMFFPTFFFTGVFCLIIVLMSGVQETNIKTSICYKAINCFFIDLSIVTFAFQFVSLIVVPKLANKVNYFNLMFILLILSLLLFVFVAILSDNFYIFHAEWILTDGNFRWLQLSAIIIGFVPLLYLFMLIFYHITIYVYITIFYSLIKFLFSSPIEKVLEKEIQEIQVGG